MCSKWIPKGSTYQFNEDLSITIRAPKGWQYAGYEKETGELKQVPSDEGTSISCKCEGSGNCMPFIVDVPGYLGGGTISGCAGNCTECIMKNMAVSGTQFSSGGYFNTSIKPYIVDRREILPASFKALYQIQEVLDQIDIFLSEIWNGGDVPEPYMENNILYPSNDSKLAFVNIAGRAVILPVPPGELNNDYYQVAGGDSAECNCDDGTCILKSKSKIGVEVTWCEASDCSGTCSLSANIAKGDAKYAIYQAISYRF